MKKGILISILVLLLQACSLDDGPQLGDFTIDFVPIESVVLPNQFQLGQTYSVEFSYFRPTTCHFYNGLQFSVDESIRTFTIVNTVETGTVGCYDASDELVTRTFVFSANDNTTYTFRFWQGVDENEEDVYLQIEVPVNE